MHDKNIIGAELRDLSKAFDSILHDLLVAKLHGMIWPRDMIWSTLWDDLEILHVSTSQHEIKWFNSIQFNSLFMDPTTFIYSYMKRRKQGVKINDPESLFKILLSGVPQDPS